MNISELGLDPEVEQFLNDQKDFNIDRVSQEGGNCDIFFGEHKIFERRIALKIYYGSTKDTTHNEPKILSKLDHPNILKVRDAKKIGLYHNYFMTDEIDGGDLEKYYKAGKLDLKKSLNIIHGILVGLGELHKEKVQILHRDIKPKNILINETTGEPLIADFGSIKHFNSIGKIAGSRTTTLYMPPEIIKGENYTTQSDIYQVGVTMFQILGGFFPDTYAEWLKPKELEKLKSISGAYEESVYIDKVIFGLVLKDKLLRYDSLPQYINKPIINIIKKATHTNLKIRYSNTSEFLNDLMKVQRKLTNWKFEKGLFNATKISGGQYRIVESKNKFSTEKLGASWRRFGDFSNDLQTQIDKINSLRK
ncbi:protein kinase domain-containing protein [Flavobacterium lacus]|uniref:non-specific serine/threonine protein kinase n=1 Tax=Flavobacterium lacus TaxID=1353778 RepID=A0A328X3E1_9FLAO|nr:protein kinase [Flavobacterium lacus]RAR51067.1 serine/threonine protein kinase [Flavobacterium lacus]